MRFDGKIAVVTGASRGIGKATALALAREGCSVAINYDKSKDKANEVVASIKSAKGRAIAVKCDVSKLNEVEAMFETTVNEFGKVDILVNNAGILLTANLLETTEEQWDRIMDVDLKSVFLCTQVAARYMMQRKYGKIVNISTTSGIGIAVWGETAYSVSKAGVIQLTKSAAFELGQYGINVNAVAPGAIDTDMLRGDRTEQQYNELLKVKRAMSSLDIIGKPEDVANPILFFASDDSRFITGKTLILDGGRRDYL